MHRLTRAKRDTIWTKTQSKPRREHTKVWHKRLSKLYQNPNQHMIEEKSNQQMIDSKTQQHMRCDIKRIKSTQQMIDKTPNENKIPIKTTNIN